MFLQIIIQYYTTYQAVQLYCLKQVKVVGNTHKHLPYGMPMIGYMCQSRTVIHLRLIQQVKLARPPT